MEDPRGLVRQLLLQLGAKSDVVLQNFRPGAMERLGLGYEDFRKVNPQIVYVSSSGFGPRRREPPGSPGREPPATDGPLRNAKKGARYGPLSGGWRACS